MRQHGDKHSPNGTDRIRGARFHIKVVSDQRTVKGATNQFMFEVDEDCWPDDADFNTDGLRLINVSAYVTTPSSSGDMSIMISRVGGADMLTTAITIPEGETSSSMGTPPEVDPAEAPVQIRDILSVDVNDEGFGAQGLGVRLVFAP